MDNKRIIPPSELIINEDGSAFHIHLTPEQLRDKIIFVGDPGRVDMVASYFDSIDYDVSSREFHAIGGTYKGKPLMVISHGIGSDNIESFLQVAIPPCVQGKKSLHTQTVGRPVSLIIENYVISDFVYRKVFFQVIPL